MKLKLNRAASLWGRDYAPGLHNIPDEVSEHWFFKALVKDGQVEIIEPPLPKLEPVAPPVVEPIVEPAVEEIVEAQEKLEAEPEPVVEQKKGHHKGHHKNHRK